MKVSNENSGYTLIEALISIVLFATVIGGMAAAMHRGRMLFRQATANLEVESRLDRTVDRLEEIGERARRC